MVFIKKIFLIICLLVVFGLVGCREGELKPVAKQIQFADGTQDSVI